jgi:hypothetical protein
MRNQSLQDWQSFTNQTHASSLIQEARNTGHHGFGWGNSTRLRDNKIQFVSAGNLDMNNSKGEEEDVGDDHLEEDALPEAAKKTGQPNFAVVPPEGQSMHQERPTLELEYTHTSMTEQVGRMEIAAEPISSGSTKLVDEVARSSNRQRSTSKSSVASEEEVIVFGGRRAESRRPNRQERTSAPSTAVTVPGPEKETIIVTQNKLDQLPDNDHAPSTNNSVFVRPLTTSGSNGDVVPAKKAFLEQNPNSRTQRDCCRQSSPSKTGERIQTVYPAGGTEAPLSIRGSFLELKANFGRRRGRRRGPSQREIEDEEEALIQDYIANMKDDETDEGEEKITVRNEHFRFYNGAGEANVKIQTHSAEKEKLPDTIGEHLEWSSGDLEEFDDMSTTDDEIAEVGRAYADRTRPSGLQYLVTAVGKGLSDACWVPGDKLVSTTAATQIQIFEEKREAVLDLQNEASNDSTTSTDEDEALDDLRDTIESEDENERLLERTARMTDEQIAQALDMQEKLGMPTNEVLLFNGQEDNEFANSDDSISFSSKQHISHRARSKCHMRQKDCFPSAEAFADALDQDPYNGFDVMDFDRPSLKPKRKGRKSAGLPFELEDEEQAFQLPQTWDNDRSKKAARKREREEMRQAGLLGSKAANGRVDLHAKYEESGMDAEQIRVEIRSFLVQEAEALALAPMAADMRASVHRLAKTLKLKSHSQGKTNGRFPILTKTPQTRRFTVDNVWEIDALLNQRRFFPRHKGPFKTAKQPRGGPKARRSGGGGVLAGASYMDGEVVGASAPEIGADNRGRAMLEKMGWTSGMGIGKVGNKGSTEVIKHVVKNTKAGLG